MCTCTLNREPEDATPDAQAACIEVDGRMHIVKLALVHGGQLGSCDEVRKFMKMVWHVFQSNIRLRERAGAEVQKQGGGRRGRIEKAASG